MQMDSRLQSIQNDLMNIQEASNWATDYLGKNVTPSNISYLIQYGKIRKIGENGFTQVSKNELLSYYRSFNGTRENNWKERLGDDLNWALSFDNIKEAETTKHVHRLHPYKGKFIPQLVEYFLDNHTDRFKTKAFFSKGDIILDPFAGSGTTLVEANELELHAVGIDISTFNALISNCKVLSYDLIDLQKNINKITASLKTFISQKNTTKFDGHLLQELYKFNNEYFPVPDFKFKVHNKLINGDEYGLEKAEQFLPIFFALAEKYNIELLQANSDSFLDKWFIKDIKDELNFLFGEIRKVENIQTKKALTIILSRTMRSCRATTHADLATLMKPVTTTYYCSKHGKICKPLFSTLKWWEAYCQDTVKRLYEFSRIRTKTMQYCLSGDSRTINIIDQIKSNFPDFANLIEKQKIKGIFSSPPYVGLIDYHEQHAYAYDLFGFERRDDLEIGPLFKGQGQAARLSYIDGISDVLNNCKRFLSEDYDVFLVANDKYNLYPRIAEKANMTIVEQFKRPVLNRTEKDKGAYSEIIFHFKEK